MTFEKGNQYARKLTDEESKKEAYRQYLQHLENGDPKESFCYDDPDDPEFFITWQTLEKYIKEDPGVFKPIKMERSMSKRYQYWMNEGKTLMKGGYPGGSPVVWQTMMRNMFKNMGWDQKELNQSDNNQTEPMKIVVKEMHDAGTAILSKTTDKFYSSNGED